MFALMFILVAFITNVARGIVVAKLWQWFVADTFQIKALSVVQAIGLSEVSYLLVSHPMTRKEEGVNPVALLFRAMRFSLGITATSFVLGLIVVQYR